ncbi:DUF6446 family protein [Aliiroseovarius sp. YM-037]|uniref:DUF6446 family protein n=1 Tax=Aliiroseovarius sp. YM-037 TaxID=3341728 RepID=UPI003A8095A2
MGKFLAGSIVVFALIAGAALYYTQVYAFYDEVEVDANAAVLLTSFTTGTPDPIVTDDFQGIDSDSSPLRYRACFTTPHSQAMLTETYFAYEDAVPLNAPGWFECFDSQAIGAALEEGRALAFMGTENIAYGFDRVVAVMDDGRGFVWHQLNDCAEVFDGQPAPEGCPPAPESN